MNLKGGVLYSATQLVMDWSIEEGANFDDINKGGESEEEDGGSMEVWGGGINTRRENSHRIVVVGRDTGAW